MSNRSRVTADFVKTVAYTPLENKRYLQEVDKKMGEAFKILNRGKHKGKGVCFIRDKACER